MAKLKIKQFDHKTYLNGAMMQYWQGEKPMKKPPKPKFGKVTIHEKGGNKGDR